MITSKQFSIILSMRDKYFEKILGLYLYPYQVETSNEILRQQFYNLGEEVLILFSRQSGKTTMVSATESFIKLHYDAIRKEFNLNYLPLMFQGIIFGPQKEQVKTDFDRIKLFLDNSKKYYGFDYKESNGTTLKLTRGGEVFCNSHCFSLAPTSNPESKTSGLNIYEETQLLIDNRIDNVAEPMLATTNGSSIHIGTAGYVLCKAHKLHNDPDFKNKFIVDYKRVIADRRASFEKDGNPLHLNYEKHIAGRIKELGFESPAFKTQYALEWCIGTGMFITYEMLMELRKDFVFSTTVKDGEVFYVGVDWGKSVDQTVVSVFNGNGQCINGFLVDGDDYPSQITNSIIPFLLPYKGFIEQVTCDGTANQTGNVALLKRELDALGFGCGVESVNMSQQSQDEMWKNLQRLMFGIKDDVGVYVKRPWVSIPTMVNNVFMDKFIIQFVSLLKEFKGVQGYLVCCAPDVDGAHDDVCDSVGLALWPLRLGEPPMSFEYFTDGDEARGFSDLELARGVDKYGNTVSNRLNSY